MRCASRNRIESQWASGSNSALEINSLLPKAVVECIGADCKKLHSLVSAFGQEHTIMQLHYLVSGPVNNSTAPHKPCLSSCLHYYPFTTLCAPDMAYPITVHGWYFIALSPSLTYCKFVQLSSTRHPMIAFISDGFNLKFMIWYTYTRILLN